MTKPIPDGFGVLTPYLVVSDADAAIAFYAKAFGATEAARMAAPGGAVVHAEVVIDGVHLMLATANPGFGTKGPDQLGGTPVTIHHYCADVDAAVERAKAAGATVLVAPDDMFWGDRMAKIRDPFGHDWSIATHVRDVTPQEIETGMTAMFAQMAKGG
jgi:uncharacterized glyoxalase superfamily protein PhnB